MDVLVTSKSKEDPNKNEGARVATTLNIDFSHSKGQITLQSRVGSVAQIQTHSRRYGYPCYFQV